MDGSVDSGGGGGGGARPSELGGDGNATTGAGGAVGRDGAGGAGAEDSAGGGPAVGSADGGQPTGDWSEAGQPAGGWIEAGGPTDSSPDTAADRMADLAPTDAPAPDTGEPDASPEASAPDLIPAPDRANSGDAPTDVTSDLPPDASSCTPKSCAAEGKSCGTIDDGCGATVPCGTCAVGLTCGGGGRQNECGFAVTSPADGVCSVDGWCWQRPLPQGNRLSAVHVLADGQVWAAGDAGTVLHRSGGVWSGITALGHNDPLGKLAPSFRGLWASGAGEVWLVGSLGDGTKRSCVILRGDGARWTHLPPPPASEMPASCDGVWGSGPGDVWVTTTNGEVLRWRDGRPTRWKVARQALVAIWGSGPDDVYAAGPAGIHHFQGGVWTQESGSPANATLALWGSSPTDVWAVGDNGFVMRRVAGGWLRHLIGSDDWLLGVWGTSPTDVWAVGRFLHHYDGVRWTQTSVATASAISGSGGQAVAVGPQGHILNLEAGTWSQVGGALGANQDFFDVQGPSPSDLWFIGRRESDTGQTLGPRVLRWNGQSFIDHSFAGPSAYLDQILGVPNGDAWIIGSTAYAKVGAAAFAPEPALPRSTALWAAASNDVWAVGWSGKITRWNGLEWRPVPNPLSGSTHDFWDVWGAAPDDVWAVSREAPVAVHWNGTDWTAQAISGWNSSVWGVGANAFWTTTNNGCLNAWDGATWKQGECLSPRGLARIRGCGRDDVWVTEAWDGLFHHFDGKSWSPVRTGVTHESGLSTVHCAGAGQVWTVGRAEAILRYRR